MADETRSRILLSLLEKPGYPAELARELNLTRTNVSNHLACLRGCGIISAKSEGRKTRYELSDEKLASALNDLISVTLEADKNMACIDPACSTPRCCHEVA